MHKTYFPTNLPESRVTGLECGDRGVKLFDVELYVHGFKDVAVDHSVAESPEIYSFTDPTPAYSQSPFQSATVENENGYVVGDGVFVSNDPVLPPSTEMGPGEGYSLRVWRQSLIILFALCLCHANRHVAVHSAVVEAAHELPSHALAVPVMISMMAKTAASVKEYAISLLSFVYSTASAHHHHANNLGGDN
ncbi:hypothetical protein VNO78_08500 [Psophocarpus tetragonolobus]|uniref:Uncharacterized protein n=1 Tax=Psophocarpus tetragonolobus TaxID=3891 RepID=A0AAN9XTT5_PSOTE